MCNLNSSEYKLIFLKCSNDFVFAPSFTTNPKHILYRTNNLQTYILQTDIKMDV